MYLQQVKLFVCFETILEKNIKTSDVVLLWQIPRLVH
jgi:hypothetical protein